MTVFIGKLSTEKAGVAVAQILLRLDIVVEWTGTRHFVQDFVATYDEPAAHVTVLVVTVWLTEARGDTIGAVRALTLRQRERAVI